MVSFVFCQNLVNWFATNNIYNSRGIILIILHTRGFTMNRGGDIFGQIEFRVVFSLRRWWGFDVIIVLHHSIVAHVYFCRMECSSFRGEVSGISAIDGVGEDEFTVWGGVLFADGVVLTVRQVVWGESVFCGVRGEVQTCGGRTNGPAGRRVGGGGSGAPRGSVVPVAPPLPTLWVDCIWCVGTAPVIMDIIIIAW